MTTLATHLRSKLERVITEAREVAEKGARAALESLAVHYHEPYVHMTLDERKLRNRLRAHGRQVGDYYDFKKGTQEIDYLVNECSYEHWHRMLFARFLAENNLLIEPQMGVAISLEECEELAKEQKIDPWVLASRYAQQMLPQIFRPDDPILQVNFSREYFLKLEKLLESLEIEVFTASDSIGWVYQFWQSKKKKEVNKSGKEIGANELPAVTQIFTEPYMVNFLIHNSLGAWYAGKVFATNPELASKAKSEDELRAALALPGITWDYLRFKKNDDGIWLPAAGMFDGWPKNAADLKMLDPCCGSGHFLVAIFFYLVGLRMIEEGLAAREACDLVLRQNIHGLELDQRCVELAAFALALTAWKYPNSGGYRPLPELNVACSGVAIRAKKEEWVALAGNNADLSLTLEELYKQFKDAPVLGSLINPESSLNKGLLFELKWKEVGPLLTKALIGEEDDEKQEMGVAARGIFHTARLLTQKYSWIATNVPYLGRSKQNDCLKAYIDEYYPDALQDIGAVFLARIIQLLSGDGIFCVVTPQNWTFLKTYAGLRNRFFTHLRPKLLAELGAGAFETQLYDFSFLLSIFAIADSESLPFYTSVIVSDRKGTLNKDLGLYEANLATLSFNSVSQMSDKRLLTKTVYEGNPLSEICDVYCGIQTGDNDRFVRKYWEMSRKLIDWEYYQRTPDSSMHFAGMEQVLFWQSGKGLMSELPGFRDRFSNNLATALAEARVGFVVHRMGRLPCTIAAAKLFDQNGAVLVPKSSENASVIWEFIASSEYNKLVRSFDNKVGVTPSTLIRPSLNMSEWMNDANLIPKPYTDNPTQWIFHGHPCGSVVWNTEIKCSRQGSLRSDRTVLQVAIARLLGYCWPAELDPEMELADEQRQWVKKCDSLLRFADEDGIVCIPSIRGEDAAAERVCELLASSYGAGWSPAKERNLVTAVQAADLDDWLRNQFFEQHCQLFHHRPFIWHIWDGRKRDGFHALVNYHKLAEGHGKGRQLLEKLTYGYLGDWIILQRDGIKNGVGGADGRLAAALELEKRLKAILEGEPPFDIFIRWKPIEQQPIGWEPDINDGVRLNIRPFMADDIPGGKRGAGILRSKPNIKWEKDRGKDVASAPWFNLGPQYSGHPGDRINDHHLTCDEKRKAREELEKSKEKKA